MDQVKFFKGCLPKTLLVAFLNTLSHIISKFGAAMKASIKGILTKSWAASLFKFQWKNLIKENFLDRFWLVLMSPDSSSNSNQKVKGKSILTKSKKLNNHRTGNPGPANIEA